MYNWYAIGPEPDPAFNTLICNVKPYLTKFQFQALCDNQRVVI